MDDLTHLTPIGRQAHLSIARTTPRFRRPNPVGRIFLLLALGLGYTALLLFVGYAMRGAL